MPVTLCENTNDTRIAYSNKRLYDLYTETHVTSSKNEFHSFLNVLSPYFLIFNIFGEVNTQSQKLGCSVV